MDDLNKAIELKPDFVDAYIERGTVFTQVHAASTTPSAICTRAIELDPRNAKAFATRATAKLQAEARMTLCTMPIRPCTRL